MTKTELIQTIVQNTEVGYKIADKVCTEVFEIIKSEVAAGNEVVIKKFGTFRLLDKAERKGRNPRTGEEITIPACKMPHFRASGAFKAMSNKKE